MPTYIRPARVDVIEGGGAGGLVLAAAAAVTIGAVVTFAVAHLVLLAVCAAVFVAVMAAVIVVFRRAASPRHWAEHRQPRPAVTAPAARPARAITAPRRAIGAPRTSPDTPAITGAVITAGQSAPAGGRVVPYPLAEHGGGNRRARPRVR